MVVFDPSCLTDIRNITMYVPTQYICKIFSKRDCGILPTWYVKSVFYCLPTHPLYVIDHFFKVRYIKLGVICLPTSSYSYHMYTMCMLSTYLCTMNLSRQIHNGAKLGVAPVARAPPLFLPRPELKYIYVLQTSAPPRPEFILYMQHCF